MNSRRLLFPLIVLLVAGGFWWLDPGSTEPSRSGGAGPEQQPADDRATGRALSEASTSPGAPARSNAASMQALPVEEAEPGVPAPDGERLMVEVVDSGGRRFDLKSIFACYSEAPADRERLASLMGNWSVERGRGEYGRMRSGGRRLRELSGLPPFGEDVTVFAMTRDGSLRGTLEVAAGEVGKVQLVIDSTSRIVVHVVDTNGADVPGVPLKLWGRASESLVSGQSGSSGRLVMSLPMRTTDADRQNLRIEAQPWLGAPAEIPVAAEDFDARREVQLVVPVMGAIEVVLGAGFERLANHRVAVYLRPEPESEFTLPHLSLASGQPVRVEPVALNQTLRVGYGIERAGGHAHRLGELELLEGFVFAGPTADRPLVELRLDAVPDHLILRGRIVDPSGLFSELVSAKGWSARMRAHSGSSGVEARQGFVRTDPGGLFEWVREELDSEGRRTTRVEVVVKNSQGSAYGFVEVPGADGRGVTNGMIELGDIELLPSPVLVAGSVVDERGNGVLGAHLNAYEIFVDPVTGEERADGSSYYGVGIGADGGFRLPGPPLSQWWRVKASFTEGFKPEQSTVLERVEFGTEDLEIVLSVE